MNTVLTVMFQWIVGGMNPEVRVRNKVDIDKYLAKKQATVIFFLFVPIIANPQSYIIGCTDETLVVTVSLFSPFTTVHAGSDRI